MNTLKRYMGVVWMLLGPVAIFFLVNTALAEIAKKPVIDTKIQWGVFVVVFIPIAIGLMIFGYYAYKGEYDQIPQSSEELWLEYWHTVIQSFRKSEVGILKFGNLFRMQGCQLLASWMTVLLNDWFLFKHQLGALYIIRARPNKHRKLSRLWNSLQIIVIKLQIIFRDCEFHHFTFSFFLSCAASFIFAKTSSETFYFTAILFLKWVTSEGKTVMF